MIPFADNFYVRGSGHRINVPSKRRRWCYSVGVNPRYPCDVSSFCRAVPRSFPARCSLLSPRGIFMSRRQSIRRFAFSTMANQRCREFILSRRTTTRHLIPGPTVKMRPGCCRSGCPLSGVKRTSPEKGVMSAFDPKRTSACTSSFFPPRLA